MVEQHDHIAIIDDCLFDDLAADDVLYLLRYHAYRGPELTGRLVHKFDVFRHQRAGNGLPRLLDDQYLAVGLDTHLLQEYVHDYQRHQRKQERVIFYTVDLEDDERLVEQRTVHILVQRLFMITAPVEVLHHVAVRR